MNKEKLIELNYLKYFKKYKLNHIHKIEERINELIKFKNIIENNLKKINKDIEKLELETKNKNKNFLKK